jgi:transcriptional regulator with XRE-family HTH domain
MRSDFSVFSERLAEARRARNMTAAKLSSSTGLAPRRTITPHLTGPGALDLYRVCQIADVLDVSVDWLTGRSNVMDVTEMPEPPKKKLRKVT